MPSLTEAIANAAATAAPEDRERVIREMVDALGEVAGTAGLQQLTDDQQEGQERDG
jgi:hypothetical protein